MTILSPLLFDITLWSISIKQKPFIPTWWVFQNYHTILNDRGWVWILSDETALYTLKSKNATKYTQYFNANLPVWRLTYWWCLWESCGNDSGSQIKRHRISLWKRLTKELMPWYSHTLDLSSFILFYKDSRSFVFFVNQVNLPSTLRRVQHGIKF